MCTFSNNHNMEGLKEIKLNILASDILSTSYFDSTDCAITRALHRAGYNKLKHVGFYIADSTNGFNKVIAINTNDSLKKLTSRIISMYMKEIEVIDFEHTLEY